MLCIDADDYEVGTLTYSYEDHSHDEHSSNAPCCRGFHVDSACAELLALVVPSATVIDTSGGAVTFTMMLIGDADIGTHMLYGSLSGVVSDGASSSILEMEWTPGIWVSLNSDEGYAGDGNYNSVFFGQIWPIGIFPPHPNSVNGMPVGSFQVTVADGAVGELGFTLLEGTPFSLETVSQFTGSTFLDTDGTLSLLGATVNLVPSPSSLALISISGLCFVRRRR